MYRLNGNIYVENYDVKTTSYNGRTNFFINLGFHEIRADKISEVIGKGIIYTSNSNWYKLGFNL